MYAEGRLDEDGFETAVVIARLREALELQFVITAQSTCHEGETQVAVIAGREIIEEGESASETEVLRIKTALERNTLVIDISEIIQRAGRQTDAVGNEIVLRGVETGFAAVYFIPYYRVFSLFLLRSVRVRGKEEQSSQENQSNIETFTHGKWYINSIQSAKIVIIFGIHKCKCNFLNFFSFHTIFVNKSTKKERASALW